MYNNIKIVNYLNNKNRNNYQILIIKKIIKLYININNFYEYYIVIVIIQLTSRQV